MSRKILIADDDFDNRTIAVEILEARGYLVCTAENGLEAIDAALKEQPELILLDLSMPKLDGWQTVERIRQIPQIAKIPIVAFTAHAMQGDEARAKVAGCDDYLSKPCLPGQIIEKAQKWLPSKS